MAEGTEIVTVSDKALTLISVENGRRVWDDVFHRLNGKIHQVRNDETYPKEWISGILPQYTRASKDDPSVERNTENKCWNRAGMLRFKIKWLHHTWDNMKKKDGIHVEEDANNKIVEAHDDFNEGAATTHPVLNKAEQQEGIESGDNTRGRGRGRVRGRGRWRGMRLSFQCIR
jgi:hypothetical protein